MMFALAGVLSQSQELIVDITPTGIFVDDFIAVGASVQQKNLIIINEMADSHSNHGDEGSTGDLSRKLAVLVYALPNGIDGNDDPDIATDVVAP